MPKPSKKILIVDDELGMIRLLQNRLKPHGFTVIEAVTGSGGLTRAKQELPDLVLLDLMIPDMNGIEVAKALRADPATKNIPVIFISAILDKSEDKIAKEIDVQGQSYFCFAKPVHNPKLISTMRKLLKTKEA